MTAIRRDLIYYYLSLLISYWLYFCIIILYPFVCFFYLFYLFIYLLNNVWNMTTMHYYYVINSFSTIFCGLATGFPNPASVFRWSICIEGTSHWVPPMLVYPVASKDCGLLFPFSRCSWGCEPRSPACRASSVGLKYFHRRRVPWNVCVTCFPSPLSILSTERVSRRTWSYSCIQMK